MARRRLAQYLRYVVAVVAGGTGAIILGVLVALPAWKILAEPSITIGTLAGAVGLPVWSYMGNGRGDSRFKGEVLNRISDIQSFPRP